MQLKFTKNKCVCRVGVQVVRGVGGIPILYAAEGAAGEMRISY
jgi:hypothetical protein